MLSKSANVGLTVILGLALLGAWFSRERVGAQEKPAALVQKWEYKIVLPNNTEDPLLNQAQFDKLGVDGWELCVAHSSTRPHYCVFKRPKR